MSRNLEVLRTSAHEVGVPVRHARRMKVVGYGLFAVSLLAFVAQIVQGAWWLALVFAMTGFTGISLGRFWHDVEVNGPVRSIR